MRGNHCFARCGRNQKLVQIHSQLSAGKLLAVFELLDHGLDLPTMCITKLGINQPLSACLLDFYTEWSVIVKEFNTGIELLVSWDSEILSLF